MMTFKKRVCSLLEFLLLTLDVFQQYRRNFERELDLTKGAGDDA